MPTIHHLSCGNGVPLGVRLFPRRFHGHMICHCLLVEVGSELALIDTGLSRADLEKPRRLGWFGFCMGFRAQPEYAAVAAIPKLGLDPAAVKHVVLTHLDLDHAGGLVDFPEARVHVFEEEYQAAMARSTWTERIRYRQECWAHEPQWVIHGADTATAWGSLEAIPVLEDSGVQVSLVPMRGHTRGHCGVRIQVDGETFLHVGDSYYDRSELSRPASWAFRRFLASVHVDPVVARQHLARLASHLEQNPTLKSFCSHDPTEL